MCCRAGRAIIKRQIIPVRADAARRRRGRLCSTEKTAAERSSAYWATGACALPKKAAAILSRLTEGFSEEESYSGAGYSDVAADQWFYKYVSFAEAQGIFLGYEDGTFCPNKSITRAEFAAAIVRFMGLPVSDSAANFSDTSGHWAESYIAALQAAGIVEGYDGKYNPNAAISRAEAVTILNRMLEREPDAGLDIAALGYENPFSDVPESAWYYLQVMEAAVEHAEADFHSSEG